MKFKLGKSKITNFFCHKNFQGKTKTGKFGKTLANFRHISGMYTGKTKKFPIFFSQKFPGKKKHWKIWKNTGKFQTHQWNLHLKAKISPPFFFCHKDFWEKKN